LYLASTNVTVSGDATDKLRAVLHYDRFDGSNLGADYRQACAEWFAGLSASDKVIAAKAADTFRNGYKMRAKLMAAALPDAPAFPLR
jgi:hypothetical protein